MNFRPRKPPKDGRVFVRGLAAGTGEADLLRHFDRYGVVDEVSIPGVEADTLTGLPALRFAIVKFGHPEFAGLALADREQVIDGQTVHVGREDPRQSGCHSSGYKPLKQSTRQIGERKRRVGDMIKVVIGPLPEDSLERGLLKYLKQFGSVDAGMLIIDCIIKYISRDGQELTVKIDKSKNAAWSTCEDTFHFSDRRKNSDGRINPNIYRGLINKTPPTPAACAYSYNRTGGIAGKKCNIPNGSCNYPTCPKSYHGSIVNQTHFPHPAAYAYSCNRTGGIAEQMCNIPNGFCNYPTYKLNPNFYRGSSIVNQIPFPYPAAYSYFCNPTGSFAGQICDDDFAYQCGGMNWNATILN
uniref:RRM domain-containing protein n=1 Tax=Oryza glumipatula TaxID=40148 RepID=A0A0E0AWZ3_9ORYZ